MYNPLDMYNIQLNNSPIHKVFSNILNAEVNKPECLTDFTNKGQCGTIPLKHISIEELTKIVGDLKLDDYINNWHQTLVSEIANEVNKYTEKKINEYCKLHNINFLEWSKNGKVKYWTNRTEYSYKGDFICGVEIIQDELIPDDFKLKKTLLLKYY